TEISLECIPHLAVGEQRLNSPTEFSVAAPRLCNFFGRLPKARRLALGLALAAAPQLIDSQNRVRSAAHRLAESSLLRSSSTRRIESAPQLIDSQNRVRSAAHRLAESSPLRSSSTRRIESAPQLIDSQNRVRSAAHRLAESSPLRSSS